MATSDLNEIRPANQLYVAWVGYQRRPESMKEAAGYRLAYFAPSGTGRVQKLLSYLGQAARTLGEIARSQPEIVWFQSPPTFVTHVILFSRLLAPRVKIIADCHNAALDPNIEGNFWPRIPTATWALNCCDLVLAHNKDVHEKALSLGVHPKRLAVLETRPANIDTAIPADQPAQPLILVPCSYWDDEPVDQILDAARLWAEARFALTGSRAKAARKGYVDAAPPNVTFTDFLSAAEYEALLRRAHVILGITTSDGIQLSVANEAVGAGKPMVLSDTTTLRTMFGSAALFTDNQAQNLVTTLRAAFSARDEMRELSLALKTAREAKWQQQLRAVFQMLLD